MEYKHCELCWIWGWLEWSVDWGDVAKYNGAGALQLFWATTKSDFSERCWLFTNNSPAASFIRPYTAEYSSSLLFIEHCSSHNIKLLFFYTTVFYAAVFDVELEDSFISMSFKIILFRLGRVWLPSYKKKFDKSWRSSWPSCHILCVPNHTVCPAHWPSVIRHLIYSFQPRCKASLPPPWSLVHAGADIFKENDHYHTPHHSQRWIPMVRSSLGTVPRKDYCWSDINPYGCCSLSDNSCVLANFC